MARVETADGLTLHAEAHGEGPALVLSCGLCTTAENWRPQVEPFVAAGLRVVLWDFRGHGRSDAPDDPDAYAMERVVDDLARIVDWGAGGGSAVLGGLSFGGLASLHLALHQPARVRALVLADTGPGIKNPRAQARWQATTERTAAFVESRGLRAFVESRAAETLVGRHPERPAQRAAADAIAAQRPHGIAHFARRVAGLAPSIIDELPLLKMPALVVVGEHDEAYLRAAEVMVSRLPDVRRVTVPGAGHMVNLDEPAAFNEAVIGFARSL